MYTYMYHSGSRHLRRKQIFISDDKNQCKVFMSVYVCMYVCMYVSFRLVSSAQETDIYK